MNVLVGFEYSGIVCETFRNKGHMALSCDLSPGNNPNSHLQMNFWDAVKLEKWDLIIAHPPCTFLCKAQLFRLKNNPERQLLMSRAVQVVKDILAIDCPRIAVENPIGILSTVFRKPDQITYPYNFGSPYSKEICLWLKGLPPLIDTCISVSRKSVSNHVNSRMSQALKSKIKSKFFPEVASAMATQWTDKYFFSNQY